MKKLNTVFSGIIIVSMLASCKADRVCSAYQSYFMLDSATQYNQFAYMAEDSFPRKDLFNADKNKNGLMVYEEYRERWLDHKTVPMEVVYPQVSDSVLFAGDVMMYAETDVVDSAALDSARMSAQTFQYNVDQKYYNWYFRDKLVWTDELEKDSKKEGDRQAPQPQQQTQESDTTKSKFSLKGIFGKKEKKAKEPKQKKTTKVKDTIVPEPAPADTLQNADDGTDDF